MHSQVALTVILAIACILGIFGIVLVKAEEQDGLPRGFGKLFIGRPHGELVKVTPVHPIDSTVRGRLFRTTFMSCVLLNFFFFLGAIIVTGSAAEGFAVTQANVGLWVIVTAAICSHRVLGVVRGFLYALAGFLFFGLVFSSLPGIIVLLVAQEIPTDAFSTILMATSLLGAACGVYLAPTRCEFERHFSDGYTDTISVTSRSKAYRAFQTLNAS